MRRIRRSERGQAMLLGVLALVVLAIGMYLTYNLSRTVYEKIALQDAADATAYSLATEAARTFNFVAYTNRTLVAKQIELLELHSEVSEMSYSLGVTGYLGDLLTVYGRILKAVPFTAKAGVALESLGGALERTHDLRANALDFKLRSLEASLRAEPGIHRLYTGLAAAMVAATSARLLGGGMDIAQANDPNAARHPLSNAFSALSVASFVDAFDASGWQRTDDARRAFAEIVNASRFAASARSRKLVWRNGILDEITEPLAELGELTAGRDPESLAGQLNQLATGFPSLGFVGTSKLLSRSGDLADLEDTGRAADGRSFLADGDVMVSKDQRDIAFGALAQARRLGFASLRSADGAFRYCRYEKPEGYGGGGILRALRLLVDAEAAGFTCDAADLDVDLAWSGIGRYLRFQSQAERRDFNEPDVWVFLTKSAEAVSSDADPKFTLERGDESVAMDTRIGADRGLLAGTNAFARAQVYHHRPGAWSEPPNFFNPHWSARLAPKAEGLESVLDSAGLGRELSRVLSESLVLF